jgi:hypothetical protein
MDVCMRGIMESQDRIPIGDDGKVDVAALLKNIRAEVEAENASFPSPMTRYVPQKERLMLSDGISPLLSDELQYLNDHWDDWCVPMEEFASHRPLLGRLVIKAKEFVRELVWDRMFKEYFHRERVYTHNVVRLLNRTAHYVDSRDDELFWQVVNKVDRDVEAVNRRTDQLVELLASEVRSLKQENRELKGLVEKHLQSAK